MQPTFNPNTNHLRSDWVLLDRFSPLSGRYQRGDVVILSAPHNPDMKLIKRIIALEGEAIRPRRGHEEGMGATSTWAEQDGFIRIPKGHFWCESDEPFRGVDSNVFGPVPLGLIDARVACILWPFDRFQKVERKLPKPGRVVKAGRLLLDLEDTEILPTISSWKR